MQNYLEILKPYFELPQEIYNQCVLADVKLIHFITFPINQVCSTPHELSVFRTGVYENNNKDAVVKQLNFRVDLKLADSYLDLAEQITNEVIAWIAQAFFKKTEEIDKSYKMFSNNFNFFNIVFNIAERKVSSEYEAKKFPYSDPFFKMYDGIPFSRSVKAVDASYNMENILCQKM